MAGSRADRLIIAFPGGRIWQSRERPGAASYDHTGQRYVACFDDPAPIAGALDIERRDSPVDDMVIRALGAAGRDAALRDWTKLEVAAKLTGKPSAQILKHVAGGGVLDELLSDGFVFFRADTELLWVAVGWKSA